jgi:hypothetical protein
MPKRRVVCGKYPCNGCPVSLSSYEKHAAERELKDQRYFGAVEVLHGAPIDGLRVSCAALWDELLRFRDWWGEACRAVNSGSEDPLLLDATANGTYWCVAVAQEINEFERDARLGGKGDTRLREFIRQEAADRFANLEARFMSDGVARRSDRVAGMR